MCVCAWEVREREEGRMKRRTGEEKDGRREGRTKRREREERTHSLAAKHTVQTFGGRNNNSLRGKNPNTPQTNKTNTKSCTATHNTAQNSERELMPGPRHGTIEVCLHPQGTIDEREVEEEITELLYSLGVSASKQEVEAAEFVSIIKSQDWFRQHATSIAAVRCSASTVVGLKRACVVCQIREEAGNLFVQSCLPP